MNNDSINGPVCISKGPSERLVLEHLENAWNDFARLESDHPDEVMEFRLGIHQLQHILAARVVRRDDWKGLQ